MDFTEVKSPIEGRISRQLVTKGNLVQADSTLLTTVVSVDPIYAYFNIDERTVQKYLNQIKRGELQDPQISVIPVYLQLESETGFPHQGVIDFVNNTYNASTGTLQIRAVSKTTTRHFTPTPLSASDSPGRPSTMLS